MDAAKSLLSPATLAGVASGFALPGEFLDGAPYGSGHINDTYAITYAVGSERRRYILQRINDRIFRDVPALMENIQRVTSHVAAKLASGGNAKKTRVLELIPARNGAAFHVDAAGAPWRCYVLIEGARTYDIIEGPHQAREAARAFGQFQQLLTDLPAPRLKETIPAFHDTRQRFEAFRRAVAADAHGRAAAVREDIHFAFAQEPMVDTLLDLQRNGAIPERVTHNDTKLNNVMLDDVTHEAVAVIDLDTVMPGLALYDFGDMVRSATNSAAEDERDLTKVTMRLPIFEALVTGYLASAGHFLNAAERAHLVLSGKLITFEIGLRFLTDHLQGDIYFKIKRPNHNLDRARNQFALVRSIASQEREMQAIVARAAKRKP